MKLGNYEWNPETDLIAAGAFAEVFRARDTNTEGRTVALKIYKEAVARGTAGSSGQGKYTLEKEFQNVDGLAHTNVITYYGLDYIHGRDALGRQSSYPVLILEYAGDGTLTDFLKTDPDDATRDRLIRGVIQGVGYLHGEGILHRDLKPGNILVTRNRRGKPVAKITDFGISRDTLTNKTIEQSLTEGVGTPHYMAPEQFYKKGFGLDGELSERTDIWAVGVIMYRMVTGRLPFGDGERDYELVKEEITKKDPDFDKVPLAYRGILKKCLAKNAADRIDSADSLLRLLDGRGSPPTLRDPSRIHGRGSGEGSPDDLPTVSPVREPVPSPPPGPSPGYLKWRSALYVLFGLILLGIIGYKWVTTDPFKKESEEEYIEEEYIGARVENDSIVNKFNNPWFGWEQGSKKLFDMFPTLIDIESDSVTLDPNSTQVLTAKLSWYPNGELIRFSDVNWNKKNLAIYYLLDKEQENFLVRLNGTSPPIHNFNRQTELIINEENAIDYAKFFGYFVRSENHQPFFLLTSLSDPAIVYADLYTALKDKFQAAKITNGNSYNYDIDAHMLYQGSLFNTTLQVDKEGMVGMLNDERIEENSIFSLEVPVN